jgi:hypothetical protein
MELELDHLGWAHMLITDQVVDKSSGITLLRCAVLVRNSCGIDNSLVAAHVIDITDKTLVQNRARVG